MGEKGYSKIDLSDIYTKLYMSLYRYGMTITPDKEEVKDSIQDVFKNLLLIEDISKINNIENFLKKSLKNNLLNKIKARKPEETIDNISHDHLQEPSSEDRVFEEERTQQINAIVKKMYESLSKNNQKIVDLYYFNNHSYDEISQLLDMNYQSVVISIHRIHAQFRKKFQRPAFF